MPRAAHALRIDQHRKSVLVSQSEIIRNRAEIQTKMFPLQNVRRLKYIKADVGLNPVSASSIPKLGELSTASAASASHDDQSDAAVVSPLCIESLVLATSFFSHGKNSSKEERSATPSQRRSDMLCLAGSVFSYASGRANATHIRAKSLS